MVNNEHNTNNTGMSTIEEELDWWQGQEKKFNRLFSPSAVKDKTFLKMKLAHYDRLWLRYNKRGLDREGRLMRKVLRSERKKLEKELYPGVLSKLPRRIGNIIKAAAKGVSPGTAPQRGEITQQPTQDRSPVLQSGQKPPSNYKRMPQTTERSTPRRDASLKRSPFADYKPGSPFPRKSPQKQGLPR